MPSSLRYLACQRTMIPPRAPPPHTHPPLTPLTSTHTLPSPAVAMRCSSTRSTPHTMRLMSLTGPPPMRQLTSIRRGPRLVYLHSTWNTPSTKPRHCGRAGKGRAGHEAQYSSPRGTRPAQHQDAVARRYGKEIEQHAPSAEPGDDMIGPPTTHFQPPLQPTATNHPLQTTHSTAPLPRASLPLPSPHLHRPDRQLH